MEKIVGRWVSCASGTSAVGAMLAAAQGTPLSLTLREPGGKLRIDAQYGLDKLPQPLHDTALLRIANPEVSLADLALLADPPVSKSCISHRMKRLMTYIPADE